MFNKNSKKGWGGGLTIRNTQYSIKTKQGKLNRPYIYKKKSAMGRYHAYLPQAGELAQFSCTLCILCGTAMGLVDENWLATPIRQLPPPVVSNGNLLAGEPRFRQEPSGGVLVLPPVVHAFLQAWVGQRTNSNQQSRTGE